MTCEDFPCCGHELGCCPDFDQDGNQLNMVCTCGAKLPVDARYSICDACMDQDDDGYDYDREDDYFGDIDESMDGDFDSAMESAGFGTDEDYNHYDYGNEDW